MQKPNWKVATVGGVLAAAGLGGFALAGADADAPDVRSVELQRATLQGSVTDSVLSSPSSTTITPAPTTALTTVPGPTTVPAPTTMPAPSVVPPPSIGFDDSADSPDVPVPAPTTPPAPPAAWPDDSGDDQWDDGAVDQWDDGADSDDGSWDSVDDSD
jgi:hypothetical protein